MLPDQITLENLFDVCQSDSELYNDELDFVTYQKIYNEQQE